MATNFKVGDRVRHTSSGQQGIVVGVQETPEDVETLIIVRLDRVPFGTGEPFLVSELEPI
jgi:hypothetical protein